MTTLYSFAGSPADGGCHRPGWCRAATAISTGRPTGGTTSIPRRLRHCVSDQSQRQLHESLLLWQLPQRWGRIQMPGWYRAATAISTGRPIDGRGERHGRHRVSDQSQRQSTRIFTRLAAPPTMGDVHMPGWCRAATAISTGRPYGGTNDDGTVFRISPSGSYTNLYSFGSYPNDGAVPHGRAGAGQRRQFLRDDLYGGTSTNCIAGAAPCFGSVPAAATRIFTPLAAPPTMGLSIGRAGAGQRRQFLRDDRIRRDEHDTQTV